MSTLIDRIEIGPSPNASANPTPSPSSPVPDPAARLRRTMAACRVRFTWWGTRKALSPAQRAEAAEAFDAQDQALAAGKKLVDVRHPAFRALTAIRGAIASYWKGLSLPYPEPGLRLIRQDHVEAFAERMADYRVELSDAVNNLDRHYHELRDAAARRLGRLYDEDDYPASLTDLFAVAWDFPAVEPPDYLRRLSPQVYAQEQARAAARFEEAVRLAEAAFLDEFARLVDHLTDRIAGVGEDGRPRVFRDSAVDNLTAFFERFRMLSVRSDEQLEALVERARDAVRGVGPRDLRDGADLRRHVASRLAQVRTELDGLMTDRPRRRLIRGPLAPTEVS